MASETVTINSDFVQTLTVGEIEFLEEKSGRPIGKVFGKDVPMGTTLRALAYIIKRRDDPSFTWEQAGDIKAELITAGDEEGEESLPPADDSDVDIPRRLAAS